MLQKGFLIIRQLSSSQRVIFGVELLLHVPVLTILKGIFNLDPLMALTSDLLTMVHYKL